MTLITIQLTFYYANPHSSTPCRSSMRQQCPWWWNRRLHRLLKSICARG